MGSPISEAGRASNETQHLVTLTYDFEVSKFETTQGEFQELMGYNPSVFLSCGSNCPVENVSWDEALRCANALSILKGFGQCYECTGSQPNFRCQLKAIFTKPQDCPGYRLPTESEWEYAARAGTTTAYHDGQNSDSSHLICEVPFHLTDIAWFCKSQGITTHPVGTKTPNEWGLFDMSGNVSEWTWDRFGTYPGTVTDPVGATSGSSTVRGGSWLDRAESCRSSTRGSWSATGRGYELGFRLVRSLP